MHDLGFDPPDADGFRLWRADGVGRFLDLFGAIRVRPEGNGVRVRIRAEDRHANISGNIHGGFLLAFVDQSVFCGPHLQGRLPHGGSVTLSANTSFIGPGIPGEPLDAIVEIVGETGRMMFVRGIMEQDGRTVASFDATLRKTPSRAAILPVEG